MKKALLALALFLTLTACAPQSAEPAPTPTPTPAVSAQATAEPCFYTGERGEFDLTDAQSGIVRVRYFGEAAKMKVQITREGGSDYNYDLHAAEQFEVFPLTDGDGTYTLRLLEQIEGERYAVRLKTTLDLTLTDPLAPFLRANQIVNYTADGTVAETAAELTEGLTDPVQIIEVLFDFTVDTISYDYQNDAAYEAGYIPDVESILQRKKGTCYDYSALLCAMARSVGVPCRLVTGYVQPGGEYHAWVEVWSEQAGTVDKAIPVTARQWSRLDPTFVSSGERSRDILRYVSDDEHYENLYYF